MIKDERMSAVLSLVRDGVTVCDVGTDHGYIPIELILSGRTRKCIMTDISAPSLEKGVRNAKNEHCDGKIEAYCTSGTLGVPFDATMDFVIAGMGGELIAEILEQDARLKNPNFGFVLQPMSKADVLRKYLADNGFDTQTEIKTVSCGRVYSVMRCIYSGVRRTLSIKERLLGGFAVANDKAEQAYAEKLLAASKVRLSGLQKADVKDEAEITDVTEQINVLEEFLNM